MTIPGMGGVVLLHGLGRTAGSMRPIERALRGAGHTTIRIGYPARRRSLDEIVDALRPAIEGFADDNDDPIHFVTHSLGGLVVRAFLLRHRPSNMGRVVMLAPPNSGSELADLLIRFKLDRAILGPVSTHLATQRSEEVEAALGKVDYPVGIIAGNHALDPVFPRLLIPLPNDGKVSVEATKLDGMTDHLVLPVSHTLMTFDRAVIAETLYFIGHGHFTNGVAVAA